MVSFLHFLYVMSIYFITAFDFCGKTGQMLLAYFNTETKIFHHFNMNKENSLVSNVKNDIWCVLELENIRYHSNKLRIQTTKVK